MLNQKGLSAPLIALIVVIALSCFYIGKTYGQKISSITKESFTSAQTKIPVSSTLTEKSKVDINALDLKTSQPTQAKDTSKPVDPNMITSTGTFQFSDHKIKYTFSMPKAGGDITGSLEGVCNGSPTGKFDGGEGGKIAGTFTAKCVAGPLDLIKVDIVVSFTGVVHLNKGKIDIIWESSSPTTERGSFTMYFNS